MPKFIEKTYRSVLNKKKFIDHWFWSRYTLNPYNGCMFGCIYCDARSEHYHMPEDFENQILIKKGIGDLLDTRISRARTLKPDVVVIGGVTDPYQPAETKYRNTRQCLAILKKHQYPVHIITKSDLVLDDIALLQEIAQQTWSTVSFTITTTNPKIAKFLEVRSPSPARRLAAIEKIKAKTPQIQVGALVIPVVPFLTDSDIQLEDVVRSVKDSGADFLLFGGAMTMRNLQASWYLKHIQKSYPELMHKYETLYNFSHNNDTYQGNLVPQASYLLSNHRKLIKLCKDYELPVRIKRFIPADFRKLNYEVAEVILHRSRSKQLTGKPYENFFWAGQHIQNLNESIQDIYSRNALSTISNVTGEVLEMVKHLLENPYH
ncbi:radical SAM protein [Fulvivirgaceae bacterium BMA10]|uniref:Radical SAM protein n=1 Tax=Splendidivirga corallicola TaxID=3051826 RepID=A0ABT8KVM8_9BACT|nr:radical SAM protein [Fulvivirgaceae bacterium BMA10]